LTPWFGRLELAAEFYKYSYRFVQLRYCRSESTTSDVGDPRGPVAVCHDLYVVRDLNEESHRVRRTLHTSRVARPNVDADLPHPDRQLQHIGLAGTGQQSSSLSDAGCVDQLICDFGGFHRNIDYITKKRPAALKADRFKGGRRNMLVT